MCTIFFFYMCRFKFCSSNYLCNIWRLQVPCRGNCGSMLFTYCRNHWRSGFTEDWTGIVPSLGFHSHLCYRHHADSSRCSKVLSWSWTSKDNDANIKLINYILIIVVDQAGDFGGFSIAFHHHRLHGRDCSYNLLATVEGPAGTEEFHHQNRRRKCFEISVRT